MFKEKVTQTIPRFLTEGYALYEDGDFYKGTHDGVEVILGKKKGLDFIGLKPDAPLWAKQEYREWKKVRGEEVDEIVKKRKNILG